MRPKKGKIVHMGSGELIATMVEVHKGLLDQLPGPPQAAFLDTYTSRFSTKPIGSYSLKVIG